MTISNFNDLLTAARQQSQPQRLLLVFAKAELPADSTPEQRRRSAEKPRQGAEAHGGDRDADARLRGRRSAGGG